MDRRYWSTRMDVCHSVGLAVGAEPCIDRLVHTSTFAPRLEDELIRRVSVPSVGQSSEFNVIVGLPEV